MQSRGKQSLPPCYFVGGAHLPPVLDRQTKFDGCCIRITLSEQHSSEGLMFASMQRGGLICPLKFNEFVIRSTARCRISGSDCNLNLCCQKPGLCPLIPGLLHGRSNGRGGRLDLALC